MSKPGRERPPQGRLIPSTMTTVNPETGEAKTGPMPWRLVPPPARCCQVCAVEHDPLEPHNQQSLYYQVAFNAVQGRPPTWADALAHCDDERKTVWRRELARMEAWSEPPAGVVPVAHFGSK